MPKTVIITKTQRGCHMFDIEVGGLVGGIISIIVGLIIIIWPRVIAYVIGGWLIVIGVLAILYTL